MTTKMQLYVPFMIRNDYMTGSPKDHVVNVSSCISCTH